MQPALFNAGNRVRVTTSHSEDFNILSSEIDLAKSPYAHDKVSGYLPGYVAKATALYAELGAKPMIWTTPEGVNEQEAFILQFWANKPIEYLLEVDQERVAAYINETEWTDFIRGNQTGFRWSRTPVRFEMTSLLISAPILIEEVKEVRIYCKTQEGLRKLVEQRPVTSAKDITFLA
jgi:hypothetical protein